MIKYTIKEVIGWTPSFSLLESYTEGLLTYVGLEGVTEVDTDPKGRFMSFKVTPFNDTLQVTTPGNSWQGRVSLKDCEII